MRSKLAEHKKELVFFLLSALRYDALNAPTSFLIIHVVIFDVAEYFVLVVIATEHAIRCEESKHKKNGMNYLSSLFPISASLALPAFSMHTLEKSNNRKPESNR